MTRFGFVSSFYLPLHKADHKREKINKNSLDETRLKMFLFLSWFLFLNLSQLSQKLLTCGVTKVCHNLFANSLIMVLNRRRSSRRSTEE